MRVLKFGGASLKDGESLKQICQIIANTKGSKAIVISAFNGVTDKLNDLLERMLHSRQTIVLPPMYPYSATRPTGGRQSPTG